MKQKGKFEPNPTGPIDRMEAARIVDDAVKVIQERDHCTYDEAYNKLKVEKPKLLPAYQRKQRGE